MHAVPRRSCVCTVIVPRAPSSLEAGRQGFPALGTALETPRLRLRLRAPTWADLPHVQRYAVREDFYRYLDMDVPTLESIERYLATIISAWEEPHRTDRVFAVEPKQVGRIAGLAPYMKTAPRKQVRGPPCKMGPIKTSSGRR